MNTKQAHILASDHYLTQAFPENWESFTQEELFNFISENPITHFEFHPAELVWEQIEGLAKTFERMELTNNKP